LFFSAGGVAANCIAKWNGTAWSALGTGMNGSSVTTIAIDGSGNVYAGGYFTSAGGVSANRIAKWNGSAWSSLGTGMNNSVYALAIDGSGNVYAGGDFTSAGGVANINRIAKWNGTAWSAIGTGMNNGVYALAINGSNVYAGGYFTNAGGVSANYIAKWNGTTWSALGTGMNWIVVALSIDGGGNVYAGGSFQTAGGVSAISIAKWNGSAWSALGTGINGGVEALVTDVSGNVYAGGSFSTAGGVAANNIAKWNGSAWSAFGTGMNYIVATLAIDGSGNVYAGGVTANYIAKWNGSVWSTLGTGMNNQVLSLTIDGNGNVYAGGVFTTAGGVAANYIAKWNGTAWSALGTGMNNPVYALATDGSGNVYAGGYFTSSIAKWNGTAWSSLGTGMNGDVNAIAIDGSGNVYAAGRFTTAGGVSANRIAKWNGSAWSSLGTGMNADTKALAIDGYGNVYAGGYFTTAGGVAANYIAKWNGSVWSALGTGMNNVVSSLAIDGSGNIYAGGQFTQAGGISANYIAKWNGSVWSNLGSGTDAKINAINIYNNLVYCGGNFMFAGGKSSAYFAKYTETIPEINVKGNTVSIVDGDITPSITDFTSFDNVIVNGSLVRTYTIENTGAANLTVSAIAMSGANSALFTYGGIALPATIAAGSSSTFTVTYSPLALGTHTATVNITNDDSNEGNYDFAVSGTGYYAPGNALNFDGTNDLVTIPDNTLLRPVNLTIEGWFNFNSSTGIQVLVSKTYNSGNINSFAIWLNSNTINACTGSNTGESIISAPFTPVIGNWYYIAYKFNDALNTHSLYVDGIEMANIPNNVTIFYDSHPLCIGTSIEYETYNLQFNGKMDEVRIWNYARTTAEIQNNMYTSLVGNETGLVAYYKFDQGISCGANTAITTLTDATSNNNNGTLTNFGLLNTCTTNWVNSDALRPVIYAATNVSTTGFTANWKAVSGSTTFRIDVDDNSDFSSPLATNVDAGNGTSFKVTGLTLNIGTTYYYRMRVEIGANTSPNSLPKSFMVAPGNALDFDGTNDYVSLLNSPSFNINNNQVTIEAWVYLRELPSQIDESYSCIFDSETDNYVLYLDKGTNELRFKVTDNDFTAARPGIPEADLILNSWIHVSGVYDGTTGTAKIYLNGVLKDTENPVGLNGNVLSGQIPFIGSGATGLYFFNGKMDEVRIWNTARTITEIQNNMYSSLVGNETGLVAYYKFDQGISCGANTAITTLTDATANNNNGTLTNFGLNNTCITNWVNSDAMRPVIYAATNVSTTGFTANWKAVSNSTKFRIDVDDNSDFSSPLATNVDAGNGTSFNVTGLTLNIGTPYYYRMRVEIGANTSPSSFSKSFIYAPGNALNFDGTDDYVSIPDNNSLDLTGNLTFSMWIKPGTTQEQYADIISKHLGNFTGYVIEQNNLNTNQFYLGYGNGSSWAPTIAMTTLTSNQWQYFTIVKNGAIVTHYINGVQTAQANQTISTISTNASPLYVCAWPVDNNRNFNGSIDELSIWNVALTPAQIQTYAYSTLIGNETGLVAYYNFDQGISCGANTAITTLTDATANNNNGTLTNFGLNSTCTTNWVNSEAMCPIIYNATNVTTTGFTANWKAISGSTKFRIDVDDNSDFSSLLATNVDAGNGTSFNVTGLTLNYNTTYYYRMRVEIGTWTSPKSTSKSFMVSPGNALDFDGSNDYVTVPDNPSLRPLNLTLEGWFNFNSLAGAQLLIRVHP